MNVVKNARPAPPGREQVVRRVLGGQAALASASSICERIIALRRRRRTGMRIAGAVDASPGAGTAAPERPTRTLSILVQPHAAHFLWCDNSVRDLY